MIESYIPQEYLQYFQYFPDAQKITNLIISSTPLFTYGLTCWGIYRNKSSTGFSIDICLSMLVSSILRILYYFVVPYEVSLLRQSFSMVFIQCLLLWTSLKYRPKTYNPDNLAELPDLSEELSNVPKALVSPYSYDQSEFYYHQLSSILQYISVWGKQGLRLFDVHYKRPGFFWQWIDQYRYWSFLGKFTLLFTILTVFFQRSDTFGSTIGFFGLFVESLLPLPQILLLNRLGSVKSFKSVLLISWLCGDLTKLSYLFFGTSEISIIFILAAFFQMGLDLVILYQYFHFKKLDQEGSSIPMYSLPASA
ncbi:hypothetical protein ACI3LY_002681 [Candidozyma auris]|uniref:Uncharacterized protein n=2 Tax=Candidozyma auris TaxID=498019 RepID=A0A2H0ZMC8_CANAR|nr:hypothetical_protein [[Candida] auris]KNE00984.2 hypothetical protein QG37_01856 [[Candida] auris]PIS51774.1 hypothetical protein B9J08_003373 [[Candida] auris]PIS53762.1 hypothetical protein CJI97_003448 [[Candida] auris]QEO21075.1 hypothetical_protein [[Candida] auris]QWW21886.1 hypothetical protein CA7LBN_000632 [[Candida] auris]